MSGYLLHLLHQGFEHFERLPQTSAKLSLVLGQNHPEEFDASDTMFLIECGACVVGFQQTPNLECGVDAPPTSIISRDSLDRKVKVASVQERLLEQDDQGPV